MNFQYLEQYRYPTYLVLNLTDNCNLECIYCFVKQKPHYMSLKTAKETVDYLVNNYNIKKEKNLLRNNEKKTIIFFGGEPTLLFDEVIKPLIFYIEEKYNIEEFKFHITTNGTLLNEERIKFMSKYQFVPLLSIDGDKYTQDYNRPCKNRLQSSFELVQKNIPMLLEYFPHTIFRSTVYKDTINNLYENFLFAEEMGFKHYACIPDARSQNWTQQDLNNYKIQLIKISNYIMTQYLLDEYPKMEFTNFERGLRNIIIQDIRNIKNENQPWQETFVPNRCGLGTTSCSVNWQGLIFSCQEQDSREKTDYFCIGDIYNGINEEIHSRIILDYINANGRCEKEDECQKCVLQKICSHGCPSSQKDLFNDLGIMAYIHCKDQQFIFQIACEVMRELTNQNNEKFKFHIDKIVNYYL